MEKNNLISRMVYMINDMLVMSILIAVMLLPTTLTIVLAEDEKRESRNTLDDDGKGSNATRTKVENEVKKEREEEDDEDGNGLGRFADTVLYVTISIVVGITGYTAWKIFKVKSAKVK